MVTMIDPIMADRGELEFLGIKPNSRFPVQPKFRPIEDILDQVMSYQNADVVARIKKEHGLTDEEAELLFDDTKRFLYLAATHSGNWSPPEQVDKGWHEFLMFTRDYAKFCRNYFGRFIHHDPKRTSDPPTGGSQTHNAILAARELFGDLSPNWDFNGEAFFGNASLEFGADMCGGGCSGSGCSGGGGGCSPND